MPRKKGSKSRFAGRVPIFRQRRLIQPRTTTVYERFNSKWTLADKKNLLRGLKKYDEEDVDLIQAEYLPYRTSHEVAYFLRRMKQKSYTRLNIPKDKVPIELWVEMAGELTANIPDLSSVFADVLSKIETSEAHDEQHSVEDPDWKMIYNYLVMQLRGEEPPDVGQIEAAIILDLLEVLARQLKSLDVTTQRRMMERKYALLSAPLRRSNRARAFELARRALEEDVLELNKMGRSSSNAEAPSATASGNSSSRQPEKSGSHENGVAKGNASTAAAAAEGDAASDDDDGMEYVLMSRLNPMYTINPFCVPIKYLNPPKLPAAPPPARNAPFSTAPRFPMTPRFPTAPKSSMAAASQHQSGPARAAANV